MGGTCVPMTGSPHMKDSNTKQHPYSQFWESPGRGSHIWQALTSTLNYREGRPCVEAGGSGQQRKETRALIDSK